MKGQAQKFQGITREWEYARDSHDYGDGWIMSNIPGFDPVAGDRMFAIMTHDMIEHSEGIGETGFDNEFHALGSTYNLRYYGNSTIEGEALQNDFQTLLETGLWSIRDGDVDLDDQDAIDSALDEFVTRIDYTGDPEITEELRSLVMGWLATTGETTKPETAIGAELLDRITAWLVKGYTESSELWADFADPFSAVQDRLELEFDRFFDDLTDEYPWIDPSELWNDFGIIVEITSELAVNITLDSNTQATIKEDDQIYQNDPDNDDQDDEDLDD